MTAEPLAVLGGEPTFPNGVPFVRPPAPPLERVMARLAPSYDKGILTNGPLVQELEERTAERLGVPHVVAVASCTAGLMLVLRALGLSGSVLLPSFTFSASAHAVCWNGLRPVFAECDPSSFQLDLADAVERLDGCAAVLATHVFGAPCRPEEVVAAATRFDAAVVFDAAHAFGARRRGIPVGGFGDAEVFSLSPTKPLIAGEGGLVATRSADLAESVGIGRDYGNPGDYDTHFVGLNARLSELHAAVALESLGELDRHLERRRDLAARYTTPLGGIPGIQVQRVDKGDESTWKDFTIAIDQTAYGASRDALAATLRREGAEIRCYFDPPIHQQRSYLAGGRALLPTTDRVASSVLSLPLYRDLDTKNVDRIVELVDLVHSHCDEVESKLMRDANE